MPFLEHTIANAGFFSPANIGPTEILILLGIILLIFGPKRLPQLARAMGQSIKDFKKGLNEVKQDIESASTEEPALPPADKAETVVASKDAKPKAP